MNVNHRSSTVRARGRDAVPRAPLEELAGGLDLVVGQAHRAGEDVGAATGDDSQGGGVRRRPRG